jgi:hypothetical protein
LDLWLILGCFPGANNGREARPFLAVERAVRHLELVIEIDSDPISGSVSNGSERSQPFIGWIELVAAIETARTSGEIGAQTLGSVPGANATRL